MFPFLFTQQRTVVNDQNIMTVSALISLKLDNSDFPVRNIIMFRIWTARIYKYKYA